MGGVPKKPAIPAWAFGTALAVALASPVLPAAFAAFFGALGLGQPGDSHGFEGLAVLVEAGILLGAWLPLAITLSALRLRAPRSVLPIAWLAVLGVASAGLAAYAFLEVAEPHDRTTTLSASLALCGVLALAASALAIAMALLLEPAPNAKARH